MENSFSNAFQTMKKQYQELIFRKNKIDNSWYNGCFERYVNPVLTAQHIPLEWRYDLNPSTNPFGMERLGINAVFNPGAIEFDGKIALICRVEGYDRKSFFAVAESENGIDFKNMGKITNRAMRPNINYVDGTYYLFFERTRPVIFNLLSLVGAKWKSEIYCVTSKNLVDWSKEFLVIGKTNLKPIFNEY